MLQLIAGVDEAGRGPLAGPVVAAAVILDPQQQIIGLKDSKKLSAAKRAALSDEIRSKALAWAIALADAKEIDQINILQATMLAMQRAVNQLKSAPQRVLVDGNRCPILDYPVEAIIKGDATVAAISAASILAKVQRDHIMLQLHEQYPQYDFEQHKGYPTKRHCELLMQFGPCPEHRRSYAPVRLALQASTQQ
ncbi:MAG: ribonuclease HII [Gammaproteobacteria bacterium]|nr:ribonuclease HII [Gammaproteobacteria bacterium]